MKKVYIAGKITGEVNFKQIFREKLNECVVLNPAELPAGLDYEDYMKICFSMIDVCHEVHLLKNWQESEGAQRERLYAMAHKKTIVYEGGKDND